MCGTNIKRTKVEIYSTKETENYRWHFRYAPRGPVYWDITKDGNWESEC